MPNSESLRFKMAAAARVGICHFIQIPLFPWFSSFPSVTNFVFFLPSQGQFDDFCFDESMSDSSRTK